MVLGSLEKLIDYKLYLFNDINQTNIDKAKNNKTNFGYYTTYFSQYRDPIYNRFLAGLFAASDDAKTVGVYSLDAYSGDPYDDFDNPSWFIFPHSESDLLLTYPSWNGDVIPTISWIGAQEGIKDIKYFDLLQNLINQNPGNPTAKDAQNFLNNLNGNNTNSPYGFSQKKDWSNDYTNKGDKGNGKGFSSVILSSVSDGSNANDYAAFDKIRNKITDYISILYSQMLTLSANKKFTFSGDTLTYTVSFKNTTEKTLSNISISNPIPANSQYINASITQNGQLAGNFLTWQIATLDPNLTFIAEFKVKIQ